MAELPAEISTALVHMDAPLSFIGEPGRLHVEILPSVSLVWAATGTPVVNFEDMMDLADGQSLEIQLPHTDQDGFLDGAGNAITGWYYTVKITYEKDGQLRVFPERDFQVLVGQDSVDLALVPAGEATEPMVAPILTVTSLDGFTGAVTKTQLGLERVDNTNDAEKPISTATQTALDAKAPKANPTFTGTVTGVTKSMVGLGNVDNTADVDKPISTAAQAALDAKLDDAQLGASSGVAPLDAGSKVPETHIPTRLSDASLNATYAQYIQLAKNPDTIITGAVTVDGSNNVTSAAVLWPDGTPGTMTITARHTSGAVTDYNITYGSPVTKTYTQPTITRNTAGMATNVPQIVVS